MKTFFLSLILAISASASDVAVGVSHNGIVGNGSIVVVPGMESKQFVLTVYHVIGTDTFAFDSIKVTADGKEIEGTVVAVCKEYDLCLVASNVPNRAKLELPEKGKSLDNMQLNMYITKEPKKIPVRLAGPDGWQWKINGKYELGDSGAAVCIFDGNYLAGVANGGFPTKQKDNVVLDIAHDRGLIIPVPIIRKFFAIVSEITSSNANQGEIIHVTAKMIDEWKPGTRYQRNQPTIAKPIKPIPDTLTKPDVIKPIPDVRPDTTLELKPKKPVTEDDGPFKPFNLEK